LLQLDRHIDYNIKGADQTFLNKHILPRVADSITEHFVLGMPDSFRGDCHRTIPDIEVEGVDEVYREFDGLGFHIGAAGYNEAGVLKFLQAHGKNNSYYKEIEKQYSETFYWEI
jgi:hypothetical protein